MVLIDVVYNHFGPEGNYLHAYCPQFFNPAHQTPWGAAINFDGEHCRTVRDFFVHNALYWVEEYRFDGLRMDAIHAIRDDSRRIDRRGNLRRPARRVPAPRGTCTWCWRTNSTRRTSCERDDARRAARRHRAMERRPAPRRRMCSPPARPTATTPTMRRRPVGPVRAGAGRGLHLPGPALGLPRRRDARRAEQPSAARRLRVVPADARPGRQPRASANASTRWPIRCCCARPTPACCCRRMRRCCSWARNTRAVTPFQYFCDFGPELADAVSRRAGARSSAASRPSPTRRRCERIPDPNARSDLPRVQAALGRTRAGAARRWLLRTRASCSRFATSTLVPRLAGGCQLRRTGRATARPCARVATGRARRRQPEPAAPAGALRRGTAPAGAALRADVVHARLASTPATPTPPRGAADGGVYVTLEEQPHA